MSDRSWFFAFQGEPKGPYPELELRDFIASRMLTAETLVWTEGMTDWTKAGDIPGLLAGGGPPDVGEQRQAADLDRDLRLRAAFLALVYAVVEVVELVRVVLRHPARTVAAATARASWTGATS